MQINSVKNKKAITIMIKMVGTSCNMNCEYCYEHITKDSHKGFSTADQVMKYLMDFVNFDHTFIVFHGGEPLLANKGEIVKILDYIKDTFSKEYRIQFQTNGTLLDDEWIEIFKQYEPNISLSISLDPIGEKDLRKMSNVNYREIVECNLKKYCKEIQNVGIVSVAHKFNYTSFKEYIQYLMDLGVRSLTINKYRCDDFYDSKYLTEKEYIEMLKSIFFEWVSNGWYKSINIQPISSLFSQSGSKICIYLADSNKCSYFRTYYSEDEKFDFCDHIMINSIPEIKNECLYCNIYSKCGGGCLFEKKDATFCEARKNLFKFIEEVKYGNRKSYSK